MARRIELELTSARPDGSWTWRAAGAREPKGVLDGGLLPSGAKVGEVLRAEIEVDVDGITVTSIFAPKEERRDPNRLELIGSGAEFVPVTTTLARRERRERPDQGRPRDRDRDRERPGRDRVHRERPDGEHAGAGPERAGEGGEARGERTDRSDRATRGPGTGDRRDGAARGEARPRREGAERGPRPDRPAQDRLGADRRPRAGSERRPRGERTDGEGAERHDGEGFPRGAREATRTRTPRPEPPAKPKPKRLRPGRVHRQAVMADMPDEHKPIVEQLLRGGMPAVRHAIEQQNEQLRGEGKPEVKPDAIMTLAEGLLPRVRVAEWRDRAEAALSDLDELDLRDLRSIVVAASDVARDDSTRELAGRLREGLSKRVDEEQATWLHDMAEALDEGRIVRALRLSSRPPKAGAPLPPELAVRIVDGAAVALTSDASAERWIAVLDALAFSPIRAKVYPAGVPASPSADLVSTIRRLAGALPHISALFGVEPPPADARGRSPHVPRRPTREGGGPPPRGPRRPVPPPPPAQAAVTPDKSRSGEPEVAGAELSDAEPTDAVLSDVKPAEAVLSGAEPTEAEPTDAVLSDAEPTDAVLSDAKPTDAELPEAEATESDSET